MCLLFKCHTSSYSMVNVFIGTFICSSLIVIITFFKSLLYRLHILTHYFVDGSLYSLAVALQFC